MTVEIVSTHIHLSILADLHKLTVIALRPKMTAYSFARHVIGLILTIQVALFAGILSGRGALSQRLVDFQVAQPPPVPHDAKQCTIQVLQWVFTNSNLLQLIGIGFLFFAGGISLSHLDCKDCFPS